MPGAKSFVILIVMSSFFFGTLDRIQKAMEKGDFEKAHELIVKGHEKEPNNPGIYYLHALLLFIASNEFTTSKEQYHPDSARLIIHKATELWKIANQELKEDLKDENITSASIDSLAIRIRDYFFKETVRAVSNEKIKDFLSKYPSTIYNDILTYKRDSLDFLRAKEEGTQESYTNYIITHPTSTFNTKADVILDSLRYKQLFETGTLADYYSFRSSYADSRYLEEVEKYILEISTASHDISDFERFIRDAKTEKWKKRAKNILFFLNAELKTIQSDSLETAKKLQSSILFPTNDEGQFAFVNDNGAIQIKGGYEYIQDGAKCSAITDNWIFVKDQTGGQIILKDGTSLIDKVEDYKLVSESIGLLKIRSKWYVYHKSGFRIMDSTVEEVEVFENQWMKILQNGKWGLYTLLGVPIAEAKYDDIRPLGVFWVFEKEGLLAVYTKEEILKEVEDRGVSLEFKFDDIELVNEELLIGFKGKKECLLDQDLSFLIPWGEYEIVPDPAGWYLRFDRGYSLYNNTDSRIIKRDYPYLESNEGWLALQTEQDWILMPRSDFLNPSRAYDSIKLISPYAALLFKDRNKKLLFHKGKELELKTHQVRSFPKHPEFIEIRNDGALGLYNQEGKPVFEGKYDHVTFLTDTTLKVTKEGKVGLVSINGDFILNPVFESINEKEGLVLTLYKGKIGCYDLKNNLMIQPKYETRIARIGANYLTNKNNSYGVINANEEAILPFKFDEVSHWNDTSYLVKTDELYEIINVSEESLISPFSSYELIYENDRERIFKYVKSGKFGLISDQNGELLKPEFTEILNIGTETQPIFFADQHLSHAGYHVVSYLNGKGDLIYSKAYRKEAFEAIICDD